MIVSRACSMVAFFTWRAAARGLGILLLGLGLPAAALAATTSVSIDLSTSVAAAPLITTGVCPLPPPPFLGGPGPANYSYGQTNFTTGTTAGNHVFEVTALGGPDDPAILLYEGSGAFSAADPAANLVTCEDAGGFADPFLFPRLVTSLTASTTYTVVVIVPKVALAGTLNATIGLGLEPTITFANKSVAVTATGQSMTATSNSAGAIAYTSQFPFTIADIDSTTGALTLIGAGDTQVAAIQAEEPGLGTYGSSVKEATLTVTSAAPASCTAAYTQTGYDITGCGANTPHGTTCAATCAAGYAAGYTGEVTGSVSCSSGSYTGTFSGCAAVVAPTLPVANIVVNNQVQPNRVVLTFSEPLAAGTIGTAAGWTVTANGGSPVYTVAAVSLASGNQVTLTLASVNLADNKTYITNAAANAHLKVTPPTTLTNLAGTFYAAGTVTEADATHVLDMSSALTFTAQPFTSATTASSVTLSFRLSGTNGYVRVIAKASGAAPPTVAEVASGTGGLGTSPAPANATGAGADQTAQVTGLTAATTYDFYAAAFSAASLPDGTLSTKLSQATDSPDYCAINNPCLNGAVCTSGPSAAMCTCSVGWSGPTCATPVVGAKAKLAFSVNPAGAVAGVAFTTQPKVQIQDANGNKTADTDTVTIVKKAGTAGTGALTCTAKAAVAGEATFSGCKFDTAGTEYVITASATGLTSADSRPFNVVKRSQTISFTSTAPVGTTVGGAAYTPTATATSGLAVTFTIDPASSAVCTISGSTVSFIGAGNCKVVANQAGNATYDAAAPVTQNISVAAPPAPSLTGVLFSVSPATAGSSATMTVSFTSNNAALVSGNTITATLGGYTLTAGSVTITKGTGFDSTVTLTGNTPAGSNAVIVTLGGAGGLTGGTAGTFTFPVTNPAAAGTIAAAGLTVATTQVTTAVASSSDILITAPVKTLEFSTQPSAVNTVGVAFPVQPVVTFRIGGVIDTARTDTVTLQIHTGATGGKLTGTTSSAAVAGVVTFTGLRLSPVGSYTLTATTNAAGYTEATSSILKVQAAVTATKLTFTSPQPNTLEAGQRFSLSVAATDPQLTINPQQTGAVTLTSNAPAGALKGFPTVNFVDGVATFSELYFTSAGAYTLTAASVGLNFATTSTIIVTAPKTVSYLKFTRQPAHEVTDAAFNTQPQVVAFSADDKVFMSFTGPVTLTLGKAASTTGAGLGGTLSAAMKNGSAIFAGVKVTGADTNLYLTATSGTLSATSGAFNVYATAAEASMKRASEQSTKIAYTLTFATSSTTELNFPAAMKSEICAALSLDATACAKISVFRKSTSSTTSLKRDESLMAKAGTVSPVGLKMARVAGTVSPVGLELCGEMALDSKGEATLPACPPGGPGRYSHVLSEPGQPFMESKPFTVLASLDGALPGAPDNLRVEPGDGVAVVSWDPPVATGAGPIIAYEVYGLQDGLSAQLLAKDALPSKTLKLANGSAWRFGVRAVNDLGKSDMAQSALVTIGVAPGAPGKPRLSRSQGQSGEQVEVMWDIPPGNPTEFEVISSGGQSCRRVNPGMGFTSASCKVSVENGKTYTFRVIARNALGQAISPNSDALAISPDRIDGKCGAITQQASLVMPTAGRCEAGTAGGAISPLQGAWKWQCEGAHGGSIASCSTIAGAAAFGLRSSTTAGTAAFGLRSSTTAQFSSAVAPKVAGDGCRLQRAEVLAVGLVDGPGSGAVMPYGAVGIELADCEGGIANVTINYPIIVEGMAFHALVGGQWILTPPSGSGLLVKADTVTFAIADNEPWDADPQVGVISFVGGVGYREEWLPGLPAAPTNVVAMPDTGSVTVSWAAPTGNAPVRYVVTASPGGATCVAVAPATSCTVTGLIPGVSYTFTVVAENATGAGAASTPSATTSPLSLGMTTELVPTLGEYALLLLALLLLLAVALNPDRLPWRMNLVRGQSHAPNKH